MTGASIDGGNRQRARLVYGDCNQALLTPPSNGPVKIEENFTIDAKNEMQLKQYLYVNNPSFYTVQRLIFPINRFRSGAVLRLGRSLSFDNILTLIELGLKDVYSGPVSSFQARVREAAEKCEKDKKAGFESASREMESGEERIRSALKMRLSNIILSNHP